LQTLWLVARLGEDMQHLPTPRARAAFTLLETMIAVGVLMIGLTAAFSGLLNARQVNQMVRDQSLAYQEIQAQIETYQYMPFKALQQSNAFKGARFDVKGLRAPNGRSSVGTVTKASNPNPYDTSAGANSFSSSASKLPIRFRCEWDEGGVPMFAEIVFVYTYRGI
jgi:type II secretory pathway pseudopilin PulG